MFSLSSLFFVLLSASLAVLGNVGSEDSSYSGATRRSPPPLSYNFYDQFPACQFPILPASWYCGVGTEGAQATARAVFRMMRTRFCRKRFGAPVEMDFAAMMSCLGCSTYRHVENVLDIAHVQGVVRDGCFVEPMTADSPCKTQCFGSIPRVDSAAERYYLSAYDEFDIESHPLYYPAFFARKTRLVENGPYVQQLALYTHQGRVPVLQADGYTLACGGSHDFWRAVAVLIYGYEDHNNGNGYWLAEWVDPGFGAHSGRFRIPMYDDCSKTESERAYQATPLNCPVSCFGRCSNWATVCSGHGTCSSRDDCDCDAGWSGEHCRIADCDCGATGWCETPGNCICPKGYGGPTCDTPLCPEGCVHGTCAGPGACVCDEDLNWKGPTCSIPYCYDRTGGCKNGGVCVAYGECQCPPGFDGRQCQVFVPLDPQQCLHGTFQDTDGLCECDEGWGGSRCSVLLCDPPCHPEQANCSRVGTKNECECLPRWTGPSCTILVEHDMSSVSSALAYSTVGVFGMLCAVMVFVSLIFLIVKVVSDDIKRRRDRKEMDTYVRTHSLEVSSPEPPRLEPQS